MSAIVDGSGAEAIGLAAGGGLGILLLASITVRAWAEADVARVDGKRLQAVAWTAIALAAAASALAAIAIALVLMATA
ncbi:MAG TPA: hypothetical protein VK919_14365 [Solirubrobacterales bacterium]|nr:hypothetical protein [Solirubrobacterales bacterium]